MTGRLRTACGAAVLGWAMFTLAACGGDDGEPTATTSGVSADGSMCPHIEPSSDTEARLVSYCTAIEAPAAIVALEFVPAVTGVNAEEPAGNGWDWPAVRSACASIVDVLPAASEATSKLPTELVRLADRSNEYIEMISEFAEACGPSAARESYDEMAELVPVLDSAATTAAELALMVATIEGSATMDLTLDGVEYRVDDAVCDTTTEATSILVGGNYLDQTGVGVVFLYHGPEDQQPYDVIFTLDDIDGQKAFVQGVTVGSLQGRAESGTVSGTGLLLSDSSTRTEHVELSWTC